MSNRPLKYLYVLPTLRGGGAERTAIALLEHLPKAGIDIDLLLFKDMREHDTTSLTCRVHSLVAPDQKISRNILPFISRFVKIAREYDVLIAGLELWPSYITAAVGKILRKRVVWISHTCLTRYIKMKGFSSTHLPLTRFFGRYVNKIITVSEGAKDDLAVNLGIDRRKIEAIPNPHDIRAIQSLAGEPFSDDELKLFDRPVILFVGMISHLKGCDLLLKAARSIINKGIDIRVILIGRGPDEEKMKELSAELQLGESVAMLGFKSNPYKYMARAQVFTLPSRIEGLPNVLIEAMACGCPIVAADCPTGPAEILEGGKYGRLVSMDDAEELAESLTELLTSETAGAELSDLGLRHALDFDTTKSVRRYTEVLGAI